MLLSVTKTTVTYGQGNTLSVQGIPVGTSGTVTFVSNGAVLCSLSLPATSCTTSNLLPAGTYPVTVNYSNGLTSGVLGTLTFTVLPAAVVPVPTTGAGSDWVFFALLALMGGGCLTVVWGRDRRRAVRSQTNRP